MERLDSYEERNRKHGKSMWYTDDIEIIDRHITVCKRILQDFVHEKDGDDDILIFSLDFVMCNYPKSFSESERNLVKSLVLKRLPYNDALEIRDGHVSHVINKSKDFKKMGDDQVLLFAFLNSNGSHEHVTRVFFERVGN